jgi:hypothetical protein
MKERMKRFKFWLSCELRDEETAKARTEDQRRLFAAQSIFEIEENEWNELWPAFERLCERALKG